MTVEEAWQEYWEKQVDPFYSAADRAMLKAHEYKSGLTIFAGEYVVRLGTVAVYTEE